MFVIWYKMYRNSVELNKVLVLNEESRSEFIHQFESLTIKDHGFFHGIRDGVEIIGVMRKLEY